MKFFVLSVRDSAANAFAPAFNAPSIAHAQRSFSDAVNRQDENSQLYAHPEDFELHCLGTFEDETGFFDQSERSLVIRGKDVAIRS